MRNRVLILSVSRKVSLVKMFKQVGWQITGCDLDQEAIALDFCDERITPDMIVSDNYDLIVPTRDAEILDYAGWANAPVPERWVVETCLDKLKFYHFMKDHGFSTPQVYFVKPRTSKSGDNKECVWQEPIKGREYSVDVFADFKGRIISIVPRLRLKTQGGESIRSITVRHQEILQRVLEIASVLPMRGHSCWQCFMTEGSQDPVWTDINLRYGGASIVSIMAGNKSPQWLLDIVNGHEVEPQIGEYKVGLIGKSYTEWDF